MAPLSARWSRVLILVGVVCSAGSIVGGHFSVASAQIRNESPPPGYPSSGCDYDQRGNWYCWGGANNQTVQQPRVTQSAPGVDPFVGCFRWFNGVPVQIHTDHTVLAGPFTAHWQTVNAAQLKYTITWPQAAVSTETLSADGKSLSGGNQYGGVDKATRSTGSSSLVGTWTWVDVLTSTVIVKADGTWIATAAGVSWHGTWKAASGSAKTFVLTASDLPKDQLTLAADGTHISGVDQYGLKISALRQLCPPR